MLYGLLNLSFWGYVIATLIMTHLTVIATTIYLHRCQAHRALDLHPIVSHVFRFWLWLTTGTRTPEWVAVHRKHHAKCETAEDPHSPQVLGIRKVFFEGYELYKEATENKEMIQRYSNGCPTDWIERRLYTPHNVFGLGILLILDLIFFGVPGITVWAIQMLWIPIFAAGLINGIGHYWGYRNFECPDAARNIVPWSILTAGEELHNNHHTFVTSAKLSVKWWEFDLGWFYIRCLELMGLAKVKRLPPRLIQMRGKPSVDLDTLTAVISNRFQVLSFYTKQVMLPIWREEILKASLTKKRIIKRYKRLLIRADHMLDEMGKQRIAQLLENSHTLQLAYQYREKLQAIWNRTTGTQKELLEALQDWCKEAEATGIQALKTFANQMKGYTAAKQKV